MNSSKSRRRSQNEIAQDIIDLCPEAEPLVEEWFEVITAARAHRRRWWHRRGRRPVAIIGYEPGPEAE